MTPSMPSKVKIGSHTWRIVVDKGEWEKQCDKDEVRSHALTLCEEMRILLDPKLKGQYRKVIVVHELLHACFSVSFGDLDTRDADTAEESLIQVTAPVLLGLLRENPELLAWLLAD